ATMRRVRPRREKEAGGDRGGRQAREQGGTAARREPPQRGEEEVESEPRPERDDHEGREREGVIRRRIDARIERRADDGDSDRRGPGGGRESEAAGEAATKRDDCPESGEKQRRRGHLLEERDSEEGKSGTEPEVGRRAEQHVLLGGAIDGHREKPADPVQV